MPQPGYQQEGTMRGYGTAIGTGQSILEVMKELDREKRGNRMLAAQMENQMLQTRMNLLERQAERELKKQELDLRKREVTSLEAERKRFSAAPGTQVFRETPEGADFLAGSPNRPLSGAEDPAIANAQFIYANISKIPIESRTAKESADLIVARKRLGLPDVEEYGYVKVPKGTPGAVVEPGSWGLGKRYIAPATPQVQSILNALNQGKGQQPIAAQETPEQRSLQYKADMEGARRWIADGKITPEKAKEILKSNYPEFYQ